MTQPDSLAFDWVRDRVLQEKLPVAVLGVSTASGIRELSAFGVDGTRPASVDDQFAIFSITKPLVAMTAMRLVERDGLSLHSELETGDFSGGITLERLLSHRGGLADVPLDRPRQRELVADPVTVFPAGSMVQYTNLAFVSIEALIDRGRGRGLETELEWLGGIHGVESIGFEPSSAPHRVHGLEPGSFDYSRFRQLHHPAAGLFARAGDLLALGSALLRDLRSKESEPGLMRRSTLNDMITSRTDGLPRFNPVAGDQREWGLGFGLHETAVGRLRYRGFGHGAWSGCQWWIYPELDRCWVLMTNLIDAPLRGVLFDELHSAAVADV